MGSRRPGKAEQPQRYSHRDWSDPAQNYPFRPVVECPETQYPRGFRGAPVCPSLCARRTETGTVHSLSAVPASPPQAARASPMVNSVRPELSCSGLTFTGVLDRQLSACLTAADHASSGCTAPDPDPSIHNRQIGDSTASPSASFC